MGGSLAAHGAGRWHCEALEASPAEIEAAALARRAAWSGDTQRLRSLAVAYPSIVAVGTGSPRDGSTLAHLACLSGHTAVLELLAQLGCCRHGCFDAKDTRGGACVERLAARHMRHTRVCLMWTEIGPLVVSEHPGYMSAAARRHKELRAQKLQQQEQQAQTETIQDTVVPEENAQEQAVPMDAETGEQ